MTTKKQIERLLIIANIINIIMIILLFLMSGLLLREEIMYLISDNQLVIIYGNTITSDQKFFIERYIEILKPQYRELANKIYFTSNESEIEMDRGAFVVGWNKFKGYKIFVYYRDSAHPRNTQILCHELLHGIVEGLEEEWFVDDITQYPVCYDAERLNEFMKKYEK